MTDFPSNSQNPLGDKNVPDPKLEKKIERIVTTEVVIRKPKLGKKVRTLFFGGEVKSAGRYIFGDILIPAMKNMLLDAIARGSERVIYGETRRPRYQQEYGRPTIRYNSPVQRPNESYMLPQQPPRYPDSSKRNVHGDMILSSREEAEAMVQGLMECVDKYGAVSVLDLNEMIGHASAHTDNKWGWTTSIKSTQIKQVREGWLVELPPVEEI